MLTRLIGIQSDQGLTDGAMASRLGVSRSYWNHVKHGRRSFTHDMAVHAAGSWPELTRELLDMVVASATNTAAKVA